jgi:hypothetical protein
MLDYVNGDPEFLNIMIIGWTMSCGFTGTTWKHSHQSGNIQHPWGHKSPGKCRVMSKWCWPFSLTLMGWCITSMHHKAKTLTNNTTWKSFVMLYRSRDWTCGQWEHGSCIMTMHHLIPRNWFKLSWPNTTFVWFDRLPTLPTWLLVIFGCSPTWKRSWKGLILVTRWHYMKHNDQAVFHSQRGITDMLRKMAELVGEVCLVTRRLFWWR